MTKEISLLDTLDIWEDTVQSEVARLVEDEGMNAEEAETKVVNEGLATELYGMFYEHNVDYLEEILNHVVATYEKRYRTNVAGFVQIGSRSSRYGSIGLNGATAARVLGSMKGASLLFGDEAHVAIDENMNIVTKGYDHDGTNTVSLYVYTDKEEDLFWEREYDDSEKIEYVKNKKQPIKVTKATLAEFGLTFSEENE